MARNRVVSRMQSQICKRREVKVEVTNMQGDCGHGCAKSWVRNASENKGLAEVVGKGRLGRFQKLADTLCGDQ